MSHDDSRGWRRTDAEIAQEQIDAATYKPGHGRYPAVPLDHEALARLWLEGVPLAEIRDRIAPGVPTQTLHRRVQRMGLPRRQRNSGTLPHAEIVRAYQEGLNSEEIAARIGSNACQVRRILRQRGVEMRRQGIAASVVRQQMAECARLWHAGFTMQQVADRLGLTFCQARHRIRRLKKLLAARRSA